MTMATPDKPLTPLRLTIGLVVGAIGVYLVVSGVLGIIAKGG
ncbi:MAG: hypothetical protein ACTHKX_01725 [Pseudolysinimonas sp.]